MLYLWDTNIVIQFLAGSFPENARLFLTSISNEEPSLSVVTQIVALSFNFFSINDELIMNSFIDGSKIIPLNDSIILRTIELRKSIRIKLPDAIIAATALVYDFVLITRNTSDFKNIEGINLLNPIQL
ncbi:MAG: type II toxin-antitoxin system VapC family toxin [Chloroherpetonaceae bacterium]|nr:type II toxin-antitoxin system VapC family toxin [Chloroherpetonaceae bacterium]